MSFPMVEAFTRVIPSLGRLDLPQGVIDIAENIPAQDVPLIATTTSVLVRSDLHPGGELPLTPDPGHHAATP
ncbi:hypothetical protein XH97_34305 [Bradyrhizobium sp. CCBAU 53380]|nr:hypothetical protein [Bradyrhizobium sp. CCBAU 53380]